MKTLLALALAATALPALADDETDFSTAPDASWQRVNSIGLASFTFDGSVARITANPPPPEQAPVIGLARGAVLGPTEYTDSAVSVDAVSWGPTRLFVSVITRVGTPAGLGTSRGYSFTFIPTTGAVELHRLDGEIPTLLSPTQFISVTPGTAYRLVLVSSGNTHTGRVYDATNPAYPLLEISANDSTYASGRNGFVLSTDSYTSIEASFDNYLSWSGMPGKISVLPGDTLAGQIVLETNMRRALASYWEETETLGTPWTRATPIATAQPSGAVRFGFSTAADHRFFRMRLLGSQ